MSSTPDSRSTAPPEADDESAFEEEQVGPDAHGDAPETGESVADASPEDLTGSDSPDAPANEGVVTEAETTGKVDPEPEPSPAAPSDVSSDRPAPGDRLRALFASPGRSQAIVGVLLALLGFAAVTQVRSTDLDDSYEGRREEELIEIFNGLTGTSDRTRREIARLEQRRRELQVDTSARSAAIEQAEQRLRTLNILAGTVPVTGPGLRITITEEGGRVSIDSLLDMVQELRTAGAEAMEFNGEVRLVASSSFSDVNGDIHLDGIPLTSPYVLEVIGESYTLRTAATFPSGPVAKMRDKEDADVAIEELDAVDIESVRDLSRPEFAEPAEGQ